MSQIRNKVFYWSLAFVLFTLPFPKYSLNSQSIIFCALCWLFSSSLQEKYKNLKKNIFTFLILSSLFWISLIGLIYTQDFDEGLKYVQKRTPFLILPLVFLSIDFEKEHRQTLLKYFSYSVVIASLFGLAKALYFKINNLGDFFYYDQLSKLLEKHTTYFALFIVVAIFYFVNDILNRNRNKIGEPIVFILFLLGMLYLLSVRVSVLCLVLGFLIFIFDARNRISRKKMILALFAGLILFLVYLTPNFQKRFNPMTPQGMEISDVDARLIHWKAVIGTISRSNLLVGAGTGDGHLELYNEYLEHDFQTGFINKYNAHNQFLEITLYFGFLGLFLLLLLLFTVLKKCFVTNDLSGVLSVVVFFVFMLTESILERHSGSVLFAYMMSLHMTTNRPREELTDI